MKTCPVCGAHAFDDAETCFGCLHRFEEWINEAARLEGEPSSSSSPVPHACSSTVKTTKMSLVASGEASAAPSAAAVAAPPAAPGGESGATSSDAAAEAPKGMRGEPFDLSEAEGSQEEVVPIELYEGEAGGCCGPEASAMPEAVSVTLPSWDDAEAGWTLRLEWTPSSWNPSFGSGGLVVSLQPPASSASAGASVRGCHARVVASACVETSEECVEP